MAKSAFEKAPPVSSSKTVFYVVGLYKNNIGRKEHKTGCGGHGHTMCGKQLGTLFEQSRM